MRYRRLLSAFTLLCGFYVRPQIYMAGDKCDITSVYTYVCVQHLLTWYKPLGWYIYIAWAGRAIIFPIASKRCLETDRWTGSFAANQITQARIDSKDPIKNDEQTWKINI